MTCEDESVLILTCEERDVVRIALAVFRDRQENYSVIYPAVDDFKRNRDLASAVLEKLPRF